jgi:hypothetical protein
MATLDTSIESAENVVPTENVTEPVVQENFSSEQGTNEQQINTENQNNVEEFKKNEDEEPSKDNEENNEQGNNPDDNDDEKDEKDEDKKKPTKNELDEGEDKYSILEQKYNELSEKYSSLEEQNALLLKFKNEVEDKEKDALISKFYMLSDEDKKDVIDNKSKYSLEDIEAKLSVICVRKKVNFENNNSDAEQRPSLMFNINSVEDESLPAWLKAVEDQKNRNN